MTSLRERLERKIDGGAYNISKCDSEPRYYELYPALWNYVYDIDGDSRYAKAIGISFKAGANSLLPLVCELAEALDELIDLTDGVHEGDYKADSFTTQHARKALQAIDGFLVDEK